MQSAGTAFHPVHYVELKLSTEVHHCPRDQYALEGDGVGSRFHPAAEPAIQAHFAANSSSQRALARFLPSCALVFPATQHNSAQQQ